MPEDRKGRCSVLTCKHCGADIGPKPETIKNALKRIGMHIEKGKNGKECKK
jgi:hypothetical protein